MAEVIDNTVTEKIKNASAVPLKVSSAIRPQLPFTPSGRATLTNTIQGIPEADFFKVRDVFLKESFFRRAIDAYVTKFMKEGWTLAGRNEKSLSYVRKRFDQMEEVGGLGLTKLMRLVARSLFIYSNAFIYKVKNKEASGGKPYKDISGMKINPVAGYFILDPCYMKAELTPTGRIKQWVYAPPGYEFVKIPAASIIHIKFCELPGALFGIPIVEPAIGDIRALRRMEETAEIMVFQEASPLYVYTVGTEEIKTIIEPEVMYEAAGRLETMLEHGGIAIPYNHKIEIIGTGDKLADFSRYLDHFKKRIFTALGVSGIDMGEATLTSGGGAEAVSEGMISTTKEVQGIVIDEMNREIRNILKEGGWRDVYENDKVVLYTPEVDIDSKIKKESHILTLWQGELITRPEARDEMGKDPMTEQDEEETLSMKVKLPLLEREGEIQEQISKAKTGNDTTRNVVRTSTGKNTPAKQKTTPKNQYGKKTGPGTQNDSEVLSYVNRVVKLESIDDICSEIINMLSERIYESFIENNKPGIFYNSEKKFMTEFLHNLLKSSQDRITRFGENPDIMEIEATNIENNLMEFFDSFVAFANDKQNVYSNIQDGENMHFIMPDSDLCKYFS